MFHFHRQAIVVTVGLLTGFAFTVWRRSLRSPELGNLQVCVQSPMIGILLRSSILQWICNPRHFHRLVTAVTASLLTRIATIAWRRKQRLENSTVW